MNPIFCLIAAHAVWHTINLTGMRAHLLICYGPLDFPVPRHDMYVFLGGFILCWAIFFFLQHREVINVSKSVAPSFTPISPTISEQLVRIDDILKRSLTAIHNPEKFVILVFGPALRSASSVDSTIQAISQKRQDVREALEKLKFTVFYGEDIEGAEGDDLLRVLHISLKEKLLGRGAHAILIMASSVGSAAEVGIFSQDPELCKKMIIAVHKQHAEGFLAKGACAEAETHGAKLFVYSDHDLADCMLRTRLISEALRLYQGVLSRSLAWQPKF